MRRKERALKHMLSCMALLAAMTSVTSCCSQGVASSVRDVKITMEGGSGKAHILSPVTVRDTEDGYEAVLEWSSKNYDYMIVDGRRYENEAGEGENSRFTVAIGNITDPLNVIGDTVAMSTPHEIEYVIYWNTETDPEDESNKETPEEAELRADEDGPDFQTLSETGQMDLLYAECFSVKYYGDYRVISILNGGDFLLVKEGTPVPSNLPDGMTVLKQPLENVYLVSTSVMDYIRQCGCMNAVRFSGTKADDWSIAEAKEAMNNGDILYAGKYSAPDYELILANECSLAIENTMIFHKPEVREKLEELGVPVLVEMSSYEKHPLGRLEWIRLYGLLFGREKEAEDYYRQQLEIIEPIMEKPDTGKTTAFFYVSGTGMINVRKPGDYISRMIGLSGGRYVPEEAFGNDENALSTMNMQMESFYKEAGNADILIYNSTIGGEIGTMEDLIRQNALFADFKAVREGHVYCTRRDFFQESTHIAEFMTDLYRVFAGQEDSFTYLYRLE